MFLKQQQIQRRGFGARLSLVVVKPVTMQPIVEQLEAIGTARANESVQLTSKVTETVRKVNFEDGMSVEAGMVLIELTNAEETAQLAEAQATLDEATRQYHRVQNLIEEGLASEVQLDEEKVRQQTAKARLNGILARLDDRLIRAPFAGILGFRAVSPGTLLSPNIVVTTLDDIRIIKLDFSVPESYISTLHPGLEVNARSTAYPDKEFSGIVNTINSRVDPVTRAVLVRAHIDNHERLLRPGMLLTVSLIRSRETVMVIPEESLVPIQDRQYVYTIGPDNTANRVRVEIGRRRPGIVEVLSGLSLGQRVVTEGVIRLRPGAKVAIKGEQQPSQQFAGGSRIPGESNPGSELGSRQNSAEARSGNSKEPQPAIGGG